MPKVFGWAKKLTGRCSSKDAGQKSSKQKECQSTSKNSAAARTSELDSNSESISEITNNPNNISSLEKSQAIDASFSPPKSIITDSNPIPEENKATDVSSSPEKNSTNYRSASPTKIEPTDQSLISNTNECESRSSSPEKCKSRDKSPSPEKKRSFIRRFSPEKRQNLDRQPSPEKRFSFDRKHSPEKRHNSDRRPSPEKRLSSDKKNQGFVRRFASFKILSSDRKSADKSRSNSKSPEPELLTNRGSPEKLQKNGVSKNPDNTSIVPCKEEASNTDREGKMSEQTGVVREEGTCSERVSAPGNRESPDKEVNTDTHLPERGASVSKPITENNCLPEESDLNLRVSKVPGRQSISEKLYGEVIKEFDKIRTTKQDVTRKHCDENIGDDSKHHKILNEQEVDSEKCNYEEGNYESHVKKSFNNNLSNSRFKVSSVSEIELEKQHSSDGDKKELSVAQELKSINANEVKKCIPEQPPATYCHLKQIEADEHNENTKCPNINEYPKMAPLAKTEILDLTMSEDEEIQEDLPLLLQNNVSPETAPQFFRTPCINSTITTDSNNHTKDELNFVHTSNTPEEQQSPDKIKESLSSESTTNYLEIIEVEEECHSEAQSNLIEDKDPQPLSNDFGTIIDEHADSKDNSPSTVVEEFSKQIAGNTEEICNEPSIPLSSESLEGDNKNNDSLVITDNLPQVSNSDEMEEIHIDLEETSPLESKQGITTDESVNALGKSACTTSEYPSKDHENSTTVGLLDTPPNSQEIQEELPSKANEVIFTHQSPIKSELPQSNLSTKREINTSQRNLVENIDQDSDEEVNEQCNTPSFAEVEQALNLLSATHIVQYESPLEPRLEETSDDLEVTVSPPVPALIINEQTKIGEENKFKEEILALLDKSFENNCNINIDSNTETLASIKEMGSDDQLNMCKDVLNYLPDKTDNFGDVSPISISLNSSFDNTSHDGKLIPPKAPQRLSRGSGTGSNKEINAHLSPASDATYFQNSMRTRKTTSQPTSMTRLNESDKWNDTRGILGDEVYDGNSSEGGGSLPASPSIPRRKKKAYPVPATRSYYTLGASSRSSRAVHGSGRDSKLGNGSLKAPERPPLPNLYPSLPPVRERAHTAPGDTTKPVNSNLTSPEESILANEHTSSPGRKSISNKQIPVPKVRTKISLNPFDSDEDDKDSEQVCAESKQGAQKEKSAKVSLNPFDSEDDEEGMSNGNQCSDTNVEVVPSGYNPFEEDDEVAEDENTSLQNNIDSIIASPGSSRKHDDSKSSIYSLSASMVMNETASTNPFEEDEYEEENVSLDSVKLNRELHNQQSMAMRTPPPFQRDGMRASLPIRVRNLSGKKKRQAPLPPGFKSPGSISASSTPLPPRSRIALVRGESSTSLNETPLRRYSTTSCSTLSLASPKRPPPPRPPPPKTRLISLAQLK